MKKLLMAALMVMPMLGAMAQTSESITESIDNQKDKLRIRVERETNGQKQVFDKTYDTKGMSEAQIDKLRKQVLDSLETGKTSKGKRQTYIWQDTDDKMERELEKLDKLGDDVRLRIKKSPRVKIEREGMTRKFDKNDFDFDRHDFNLKMDRLNDRLKDWSKAWGDAWDKHFRFENPGMYGFNGDGPGTIWLDGSGSSSSSTVKGLSVFPNVPFNNKLNVRFTAPKKGDVSITVTDVNGKEVGKERIKDFEGDYLGQVEIKKENKGTLFVTVTQGDDGVVKRVVVK